ncbi:MAG: SCP2 sterol-binding domain-containing protein [Myxococcota bacterium]
MSLTPKQIFEEKIADRLAKNPNVATEINSTYQFELTGDGGGSWAVDLTKKADFVVPGTIPDPKVTITMTSKDFVDLVEGRLNGQMAFMQGKLKLKGDMALALKLQKIVG